MAAAFTEILPGKVTAQSVGGNIKKLKPPRRARPIGLAGNVFLNMIRSCWGYCDGMALAMGLAPDKK